MTPIEKLRRIADSTALDGVADAIREVADEMDDHAKLLHMIAVRALTFPHYPMGSHLPEVFEAVGMEQPKAEVADEMDWRPIETAPKDGSFFLITNIEDEKAFYEVGKYRPYTVDRYEPAGDGLFKQVPVVVMEFTHDNFHRATHWCPVIPAIKNFREE